MDYSNGERKNSGVAWSALILSLLAIVFSWTAFNRSGQDVEDIVAREVEESTQEMEEKYQALEARVRGNVAEDLEDASADVSTDSDPSSVGE